jgi:hypothetical protein
LINTTEFSPVTMFTDSRDNVVDGLVAAGRYDIVLALLQPYQYRGDIGAATLRNSAFIEAVLAPSTPTVCIINVLYRYLSTTAACRQTDDDGCLTAVLLGLTDAELHAVLPRFVRCLRERSFFRGAGVGVDTHAHPADVAMFGAMLDHVNCAAAGCGGDSAATAAATQAYTAMALTALLDSGFDPNTSLVLGTGACARVDTLARLAKVVGSGNTAVVEWIAKHFIAVVDVA